MKGGETFYDVLGVDKKCSQDDIKKAYRKLSFIHHPDKNGNSQESTENFQKISEAFTVLSDPDERMKYDITQQNPFMGSGGGGVRINPMDIFNMFMGGGGGGGMENHPMSGFMNLGGLGGFGGMPGMPGMHFNMGDIFGNMFGGQGGQMRQQTKRPKGANKVHELPLSLSDFYLGKKMRIDLDREVFCVEIGRAHV